MAAQDSHEFTGLRIPEPDSTIQRAAGHQRAIRAEGDTLDPVGMATQPGDLGGSRDVPQPQIAILCAAHECAAIRAKGDRRDLIRVAAQCGEFGGGGELPDLDRRIRRASGEQCAIWAEGDGTHITAVTIEYRDLGTRRETPEPRGAVGRARGEQRAIRAEGDRPDATRMATQRHQCSTRHRGQRREHRRWCSLLCVHRTSREQHHQDPQAERLSHRISFLHGRTRASYHTCGAGYLAPQAGTLISARSMVAASRTR